MAIDYGICFICGKLVDKGDYVSRHLRMGHRGGDEKCYLLSAEDAENKGYWLFFSIPTYSTLSDVDDFLRDIWCDCCGHKSEFYKDGEKCDSDPELAVGDKLRYVYDPKTPTEIDIAVIGRISRKYYRKTPQLLARNLPLDIECELCGDDAMYLDTLWPKILCKTCAEIESDPEGLVPISNSPRFGKCCYDGSDDIWVFDPRKPLPQPNLEEPPHCNQQRSSATGGTHAADDSQDSSSPFPLCPACGFECTPFNMDFDGICPNCGYALEDDGMFETMFLLDDDAIWEGEGFY